MSPPAMQKSALPEIVMAYLRMEASVGELNQVASARVSNKAL
jgi:hypothetical protein